MLFRDLVGALPPRAVVIQTDAEQHLASALTSSRERPTTGNGLGRIAVSFPNDADLLRALVAADGAADAILLVPPRMPSDDVAALMVKGDVSRLYSDRQDADARPLEALLEEAVRAPAASDTQWLVATSGTTDEPKIVAHSLASLTRTMRRSSKGANFVWGQLYDSHRFAGLQVLLQAVGGGSRLVSMPVDSALSDKLDLYSAHGVNALSATPTLWRKIMMTPGAEKMKLRSITLGGEICDQQILNALQEGFPGANIRHIYASTEAGTGFSVNDGLAGFPAAYLEDGYNGIAIKLVDGILHIQNSDVRSHYVGEDISFVGERDYINTGDRVVLEGDRVYFLGRSSGIINVGGDKVYPEHVERVLNGSDNVSLSKVYAKKSSMIGQLVAADILPADGADRSDLQRELHELCREQLAPYERPVLFRVVDTIAVSENGKVLR